MEKSLTVNGKEYNLIRLLGHGKGGYSYLATETDSGQEYVLKQIHHEPCDYYQFGNKIASEKNDYARLLSAGIRMPKLIDIDEANERLLKEYINGPTVCELILSDHMKEEYVVQIREMCEVLYPLGINIDYFPTNFVVCAEKIYYIDFECNDYMEKWNFENWGIKYWSKTPELLAAVQ